jgi:signal transduction histidine kinase
VDSEQRAGDRLSLLIDDQLDVARLQSGAFTLRLDMLNLGDLVREVVDRNAEQMPDREIVLHGALDRPVWVEADPTRLEQILDNVLGNALKYSPDGCPIEVTIGAEDGAIVMVRDRGIGLPDGAAERIFEPFGRAQNAVQRNLPGMGLGLYICRRIAELHGGTLWAESPGEDQGTTLTLRLPLAGGR